MTTSQILVLPGSLEEVPGTFANWRSLYNRTYSSEAEEAHRQDVFAQNAKYIMEQNAQNGDYQLAINEFADLTWDEFKGTHLGMLGGGALRARDANSSFSHADVIAAEEVDWRSEGAVTEVKNQAMCGSCWAFSTTGSIEGINAIKTGQLVSLSEQELVNCDTSKDMGCGGGLMDYAFDYVEKNGGLDTEQDFEYWGFGLPCNHLKERRHVVTIDGHEDVPENDEASLTKAVSQQPVSVAICASQGLQFYSSGIVGGKCCTELDHGVLAVGYGMDKATGKDYWIVKNSWGKGWGEQGFFRMARNVADKQGMCGIAKCASYPLKTHPNPTKIPNICGWWGLSECDAGTTCSCTFNPLPFLPFAEYTCLSWGCAAKA
jgi:C1A family cysteine protease